VYVADYPQCTGHISIQCAVTHCGLALIGSVEQDMTLFIRKGPQQGSPDTCLDVFFCDIRCQPAEGLSQALIEGVRHRLDRNDLMKATCGFYQLKCIRYGMIARICRGH